MYVNVCKLYVLHVTSEECLLKTQKVEKERLNVMCYVLLKNFFRRFIHLYVAAS